MVSVTSFLMVLVPMLPLILFSGIHQSKLNEWVEKEDSLHWYHSYS